MALTKKIQKLLNERLLLIDREVDSLNVEDIQEEILKKLSVLLIKELDLDSENRIKATTKNLKAVQKFKKLRTIIINDEYKAKVGRFVASFNKVRSLSDDYITEL